MNDKNKKSKENKEKKSGNRFGPEFPPGDGGALLDVAEDDTIHADIFSMVPRSEGDAMTSDFILAIIADFEFLGRVPAGSYGFDLESCVGHVLITSF